MIVSTRRVFLTVSTCVLCLGFAGVAQAQCFNPPVAPAGYWKADGNTFDAAGGHDATLLFGATYDATGLGGQAFQLDGENDFCSVPHDATFEFGTADFTISVWVKFVTLDGEQVLVEHWLQSAPEPPSPRGWTLTKLSSNSVRFATTNDANVDSPVLSLPLDTWTHFAVRRIGGTCTMFHDGAYVTDAGCTGDLDVEDVEVGLVFGARSGNYFNLDGSLDEVQIFAGTGLSDIEIAALYAAGGDGTCIVADCGDGATQPGEACDDGNAVPADGCENDCTLSCGNGVTTGSEVCDDGNLVDGDGCDSNCTPTACGNGAVSPGTGETCDDGNLDDGDGCDSNCTFSECGNGILTEETGEHCDDGNLDNGDGCESACGYPSVSVDLPPGGGEVTTDPDGLGASPGIPAIITFETTNAGTVTLDIETGNVAVEGVVLLGVAFEITAPPATAADPLVITIVLDGSIIAPGVDLSQFQGLRNGVPLLDCLVPVMANPDPCLAGLLVNMDGDIEVLMRTSAASRWQVGLRGQNKDEQGCVNALNGAGTKVAKARAKAAAACLKDAAAGDEPDAQGCLTSDESGKVGKVLAKTAEIETKKCTDAPPFAFTGNATVNPAAEAAAVGLVADLFGANLTTAVLPDSNEAGSTCQAAVLKSSQKLFDTKAKLLASCVKSALAGKPELVVAPEALVDCFALVNADPKGKIAKSEGKLDAAFDEDCTGVALATAIPGACAGAGDATACLDTRIDCRLCTMLDTMDDLDADCDEVDDGEANASCP